jgi:WD40 repeat protein
VVWDVPLRKPIRAENKAFTALAFSPDSALLAGGNNEGTVTLWSRKQEEAVAVLPVGRTAILCLAFGRNPRRQASEELEDQWLLAAGETGSVVTIWNLRTKQHATCRGSAANVNAVAFSPDGTILAFAGRAETKLWDVATGQPLLNLVGNPYRNWLTGVAFSPDGTRLVVSSQTAFGVSGAVDVWELENGRGIQTLRGLANRVVQISISPDDRLLAALDENWHIAIWDLLNGRLLHVLEAPRGYYADNAGLAFSPNGDQLAFSTKTTAKLWEVATGKQIGLWPLSPGLNDKLAFDPTGKKLLLVRVETERAQLPLLANVLWNEHPRVVRAYDLLRPAPMKAFVEIKEFKRHAWVWEVAPDASYFVMEGIPDAADPLRHTIKALDGATGAKELLLLRGDVPASHQYFGAQIDPTGKLLVLEIPTKNRWTATMFEMPSGKMIRPLSFSGLPNVGAKLWYAGLIYRDQEKAPLVDLDLDSRKSAGRNIACFSTKSARLARGNLGWHRDGV